MKPRRWYSGPEVNPHPQPAAEHPFPNAIYWIFTARTQREQGAIIRRNPPAAQAQTQQRKAAVVLMSERVRRTDAA